MKDLAGRFAGATAACRAAFTGLPPQLQEKLAGSAGNHRAWELLGRATALRHPEPQLVEDFRRELGGASASLDETDLAHALLLAASLQALSRVPSLPVSDAVKELFVEEFLFYAAPPAAWRARFRFSDVRFQEMGRIATLQRFPAGQYHWELAAFPRSWLPRVAQRWAAVTRAFLPMKGFGPLFELHLNDRRKNRVMLLEKETALSCYRAARSLELQPAVKGIMTSSWFYCVSTGVVTPHLAWLRRFFLEAGAVALDLGEAPADAGFLVGSPDRRRLYEEGKYRPQLTCMLWPRRSVLQWAELHAELEG